MKVSEVIDRLEDIQHKHGDVDAYVLVWTTNDEMYEPPRVVFDGTDAIIK
jgi:hypothetical protein